MGPKYRTGPSAAPGRRPAKSQERGGTRTLLNRAFHNDPGGEGVQPPAAKKGCWLEKVAGWHPIPPLTSDHIFSPKRGQWGVRELEKRLLAGLDPPPWGVGCPSTEGRPCS